MLALLITLLPWYLHVLGIVVTIPISWTVAAYLVPKNTRYWALNTYSRPCYQTSAEHEYVRTEEQRQEIWQKEVHYCRKGWLLALTISTLAFWPAAWIVTTLYGIGYGIYKTYTSSMNKLFRATDNVLESQKHRKENRAKRAELVAQAEAEGDEWLAKRLESLDNEWKSYQKEMSR